MDLRKGIFKIDRTTVPLLCATETAPLICNAVTLLSVLVAAMSGMTHLAKVRPTFKEEYTGVLELGPPNF